MQKFNKHTLLAVLVANDIYSKYKNSTLYDFNL